MIESTRIREYEPGDSDAVLEAYRSLFEGDVDGRAPDPPTRATWEWRQRAGPGGFRAVVGLREGRVVSVMSGCAQRVLLDGEPAVFNRIDDMRIAPGLRRAIGRPGVHVRTGRAYAERFGGADRDLLMWGYPTPAAWRVGNGHLKAEAVRTQFKLAAPADRPRPGAASGVEVVETDSFPDEVEALFAVVAEGRGAIAVRDAAWLNWRFVERPDRTYVRGLAMRGGHVVGLAVFRRGELDGETGAGAICDWLVPPGDGSAADALLAWTVERARAAGCEQLVALFPETSPEWRWFQDRAGFVAKRLRKRFLLAYRPFTKRLRAHWLYERWHYSLGDTDFC